MLKRKKKTKFFIGICLLVSLLAGCREPELQEEMQAGQKDAGQAVYKEFEYDLSFLDGSGLEDICRLDDGSMVIWSKDNRMFCLPAGKKEWVEESYEDTTGWYEKDGVMTRLSKDGARISYTVSWEGNCEIVEYLYTAADGHTAEGSFAFEENEYFLNFYFSGNGTVYYKSGGGIYQVDAENGTSSLFLETNGVGEAFFCENRIYIPDRNKMYIYDLVSGEQLGQNKVLDAFMALKEDTGDNENLEICLMEDEKENLFFLFPDGLYRYGKDGTAIEQIFEADITQDGILYAAACKGFYQTGGEKYEMFFTDGVRRVYGTHIVREPEVTLTLYRLQREQGTDDDLKKAIKKYEELHPEIRIQYVIGMQQADMTGLNKEDVIRNLNLELAAGTGPDLLITDGLPVESYLKQGIFADISPIVRRVDEEEGLLPQIIKHYQNQDGAVYRIPLGFTLNAVWGPESILGEDETISLKQFAENYTAYYENPDNWPDLSGGNVEDTMKPGYFAGNGWWAAALPNQNHMISGLAPSCIGAWITPEGGLKEEAIEEYLICLKEILETDSLQYLGSDVYLEYEAKNPGASVLDWANSSISEEEIINDISTKPTSDMFVMDHGINFFMDWVPVRQMYMGGEIGNLGENTPTCLMIRNVEYIPGSVWKLFEGQTSHTFIPRKTIGIAAQSKKRQEAEAFLEFLLSQEASGEQNSVVFSVNVKALENNFEVFENMPFYGETQIDCSEYIERLKKAIDGLEMPAPEYPELLNAVALEGCRYLRELCTIEEAMENIRKRMEIVMAE